MEQHTSGYRHTKDAEAQHLKQWRLPRWLIERDRAHLRETGVDVNTATRTQLCVLREIIGMSKKRQTRSVIYILFKDRHVADRADLIYSVKQVFVPAWRTI